MNNRQLRNTMRVLHLVEAIVLGVFIYGPWGDGSVLEVLIQLVLFPALGISGLIMWQQPRISKFLRSRNAT
ncbi:MAG: hypothetical protein RLP44_32715 [Aggregatilineales bacterium]